MEYKLPEPKTCDYCGKVWEYPKDSIYVSERDQRTIVFCNAVTLCYETCAREVVLRLIALIKKDLKENDL